jgi:hypothetical protein
VKKWRDIPLDADFVDDEDEIVTEEEISAWWQLVASQPMVSPETVKLAREMGGGAGGAPA